LNKAFFRFVASSQIRFYGYPRCPHSASGAKGGPTAEEATGPTSKPINDRCIHPYHRRFRMHQPPALQMLVASIPDAALRPMLTELLLQTGAIGTTALAGVDGHAANATEPAPTAPTAKLAPGRPQGSRHAGETAVERTARLARHAARQRVRDAEKR